MTSLLNCDIDCSSFNHIIPNGLWKQHGTSECWFLKKEPESKKIRKVWVPSASKYVAQNKSNLGVIFLRKFVYFLGYRSSLEKWQEMRIGPGVWRPSEPTPMVACPVAMAPFSLAGRALMWPRRPSLHGGAQWSAVSDWSRSQECQFYCQWLVWEWACEHSSRELGERTGCPKKRRMEDAAPFFCGAVSSAGYAALWPILQSQVGHCPTKEETGRNGK